jgi:hypothetical protein
MDWLEMSSGHGHEDSDTSLDALQDQAHKAANLDGDQSDDEVGSLHMSDISCYSDGDLDGGGDEVASWQLEIVTCKLEVCGDASYV